MQLNGQKRTAVPLGLNQLLEALGDASALGVASAEVAGSDLSFNLLCTQGAPLEEAPAQLVGTQAAGER